jgi:hypothetical protein
VGSFLFLFDHARFVKRLLAGRRGVAPRGG